MNFFEQSNSRNVVLIILFCIVCFFPFLGGVHLFDWDEINFAECAREMLVTKNYSQIFIDYKPFWEKPPLFIWMQAGSMYLFGINDYAARFPNAICGVFTLLSVYYWGRYFFDKSFGMLWSIAFACSLLPHFYFKSGIIDPWFNWFIFNGLVLFLLFIREHIVWKGLLGACFIGLAVLTKGPVAILISGVVGVVLALFNLRSYIANWWRIFLFIAIALLVSGTWFAYETIMHGTWFVTTFVEYQIRLLTTEDAGHGGPWFYHSIVLLVGCFPSSIFAFAISKNELKSENQKAIFQLSLILFFVVLILFSIVQSKIVHYSSLCYFPLTMLAVVGIRNILSNRENNLFKYILLSFLFLIGIVFAAVPFIGVQIKSLYEQQKLVTLVNDVFTMESLGASVQWFWWQGFGGFLALFIGVYLLFVKMNVRLVLIVFFTICFLVQFAFYFFVNNIETYSQRAFVEMCQRFDCENKSVENCEKAHLKTLGFKSYAHLWYTKKPKPILPEDNWDTDALMKYKTQKPVYAVCKINRLDEMMQLYPVRVVYRKNGYVLLKRM